MKDATTELLTSNGRIRLDQTSRNGSGINSLQQAEEKILSDLINALLAEGLWDVGERGEIIEAGELLSTDSFAGSVLGTLLTAEDHELSERRSSSDCIKLFRWRRLPSDASYLLFPVRPAIVQAYRYVTGGGVYEVSPAAQAVPVRIGAMEVWSRITGALYPVNAGQTEGETENGVTRLTKLLQLTLEQTGWTCEEQSGTSQVSAGTNPPQLEDLAGLERLAAFRDRPFHPVAKAKGGWSRQDYQRYSAEFGQPITLRWVAVQRRHLLQSGGVRVSETDAPPSPAELLLSVEEQRLLKKAMQRLQLPEDDYIALPVHPWQLDVILPVLLANEQAAGDFVPLDVVTGTYYASSSARSLAPASGGTAHVKLPLGIVSLGAVRYLPAVHMMNGERGQRLLEQAKERDPVLRDQLSLCDETCWWAYLPESADYFDDPPRHLSALVRKYPSSLMESDGTALVPMSALAAYALNGSHVLDAWMRVKGEEPSPAGAEVLFGEVCLHFLHLCLRLFRLGVMPEIHGQNAVLVLKDGHAAGLLLRDHDSVRLYLPWMEENGLADPCYKMKPGYPNSLYNGTPQKLLYYLQTLGIQVNLYSILEAVTEHYGIRESRLWQVMKSSLLQAMELAELSSDVRAIVEQAMFDQPVWPWKNLLKPLLEQEGVPSGSMPSGAGRSVNPFHRLSLN
ncbi:IucA/IucC family protein [Paenibacillus sp. OAS669]|uniref:IucA/IucC family protein n=1 Tax=Paenibacillus sp. OAS669 TaxID=2663821 RepID=UPI001789AA5B|nr:IucA/IucC family protein [Paenibacillus sp. OAS669]MBE1445843.1 siderophore synthetase component [Paenibacillus sp. OAS669]